MLVERFTKHRDLDFVPNLLNKKVLNEMQPVTGSKEYFLLHNFHLESKGKSVLVYCTPLVLFLP